MKRILSIFLVMLLLVGCGPKEAPAANKEMAAEAPAEESASAETQSMALGSFEAQTLTGETLTDSVFSDAQLTVINVWATFCGPCKEEMPVLAKLD